MYGGNKGILFSRGFPLLMVTGGWLVVLHIISESKLPVAVDGNLIFFFFFGCEIPSFWGTKNCLGTDASTLDRKKETRLHTAREEVREECFAPPPPPFFLDRLPPSLPTSRNQPIYLTNHRPLTSPAKRYGRLIAISNRFLGLFFFFFCFFNADFFIYSCFFFLFFSSFFFLL